MLSSLITEENVLGALKEVYDPEVGVNIVDLGLVYGVDIDGTDVRVRMTLTTPGCPLHLSFSEAVDSAVRMLVPGVGDISVDLVWDPPWSADLVTEEGRRELGWR